MKSTAVVREEDKDEEDLLEEESTFVASVPGKRNLYFISNIFFTYLKFIEMRQ